MKGVLMRLLLVLIFVEASTSHKDIRTAHASQQNMTDKFISNKKHKKILKDI